MKIGPLVIEWITDKSYVYHWRAQAEKEIKRQIEDPVSTLRMMIARIARSVAKDFLGEWREAIIIEERMIRGEPVSDEDMNFLNRHKMRETRR